LNPRTLWKRDHPLGTIEKVVFTSEPNADVPAYFSVPKAGSPPYPVMICLQGHSGGMYNDIAVSEDDETTPIDVPGDRDFTFFALRNGFAALAMEQRSFGERKERAQERAAQGCTDSAMHALMLGRTLAGERTYDVDRAIDFLETRPEVDPSRVGCMGNSGGGTITLYASAMLPRLAFAMPSCSFCTFRDSIMAIHHCPDNYLPGILRWADMGDIQGLFAPKPLVIVVGQEDTIFPIDGARQVYEQVERIYAAAGAPDKCRLVVGPEGHRFYGQQAYEALGGVLG
jgi:dienelactone hydrolase